LARSASREKAFAIVDGESEDFFLEAELERCCSETEKKWKGHVQRMVKTADGRIVRERFVARAAFSTYAFSEANKLLAKQGVILKLSNANGPYAECHLPLKNFDIDLKDWKLGYERGIFRLLRCSNEKRAMGC
jgi:hypothetical protein